MWQTHQDTQQTHQQGGEKLPSPLGALLLYPLPAQVCHKHTETYASTTRGLEKQLGNTMSS